MKIRFHVAILFFVLGTIGGMSSVFPMTSREAWIDRSHSIFFPSDLGKKIEGYQTFTAAWWNFLVIDGVTPSSDIQPITDFCRDFQERLKLESIDVVMPCDSQSFNVAAILKDWAYDSYLRDDKPSDSIVHEKFRQTLARASLPIGREMIQLLRIDPLGSYETLRKKLEDRFSLSLDRSGNFFFDPKERRMALPVQIQFRPSETIKTKKLMGAMSESCQKYNLCDRLAIIGPHTATFSNEELVSRDLKRVSNISLIILAAFLIALISLRLWRCLIFVPAVLMGVFLAALTTILAFGSVHGLTLSFGSGVVGLCVDYGFLSLFSGGKMKVWRANLTGLLTTVAVFAVVGLSSIPLLRQLAFFSISGLIFGFCLLLLSHYYFRQLLTARPFAWNFNPRPLKFVCAALLVLASFLGLVLIRPSLDMAQFNVQDSRSALLSSWMFNHMKTAVPLFEIHADSELIKSNERFVWAGDHKIQIDTPQSYLPSVLTQEKNLSSWREFCQTDEKQDRLTPKFFSSDERTFFAPFLREARCKPRRLDELNEDKAPQYLSHLYAKGPEGSRWLTLWFPKTSSEASEIQNAFPGATSLKTLVASFPTILSHELLWMGPLSILLVTLIHLIFFRNLFYSVLALLPFFSGVGVLSVGCIFGGIPFSFVSLIGVLMIYGFSLDYGIFSVEAHRHSHLTRPGTYTALFFAAVATFLGFVPLVFCKHPVLSQLGQALSLGAIGAYLGAIWGIPFLMEKYSK